MRKMRVVELDSALIHGATEHKILDKNHYNLPKCEIDENCEAYQSMRQFIIENLKDIK